MSQKIIDWFREGLVWKISTVVAGSLLLLTLLVLTLYRIRKRRVSKNHTLQDPTVEISAPQDNTFMRSHSARIVHATEIQECSSHTEKPHVKSKMLRSFRDDIPNSQQPRKYGSGNEMKSTSNELSTLSHQHNSNLTNLQQDNKCKEVIYQNQENIRFENRSHFSTVTETQPIYQNNQHILKRINLNKKGVKEEVIYQNT